MLEMVQEGGARSLAKVSADSVCVGKQAPFSRLGLICRRRERL
jgi:hypothetical protein